MMQKPITAGDRAGSGARGSVPVRVVLISLDGHMAGAVAAARTRLREEIPGLEVVLHAATDWEREPETLSVCLDDIARGDIVFANMLFMENHIQPVLPALQARRDNCDAMVGAMSAGEVIKLTRLGGFEMAAEAKGVMALLKRLRGGPKTSGRPAAGSGAKQMAMLRRLPKILRFIPGTAQDVRAYFLTLQYWLAGSDENVANMIRFLVQRYATGPRAEAAARLIRTQDPVVYPDVGLYHPRLPDRIATRVETLPNRKGGAAGTVGLLVMRSYVLSGDTGHYDGVIAAMEAKGLRVIPAFASGLDSRPAIDAFFRRDGKPVIDALVSLTGFSLVGGPAYNDSRAAETALAELDVPFLSAHAVEFQSLGEWAASSAGLTPVEATMMVAIPEIDGATGPTLFGGRTALPRGDGHREMTADLERAGMLARRVTKLIALRRRPKAERNIAVTIFNFPPNAGAVGTAAHLSVFASLFNTLTALKADGYAVDLPESVDALRSALLEGNAARHGAQANVHEKIAADDHVRREPHLAEIEAQWGPAPGRQQSDGSSIFVLGAKFGNVFVGIQPAFGYEGDPMRLLFEKGFAPTHAFSAYYRWLREDFGADAVLHFGTHGALEFMPGKQVGLSGACWPDRLIQDLPNVYLYAANNPSEGTIAKRRAAAVLVSYLTPPVAHAGLYRGLADLKATIERWRAQCAGGGRRAARPRIHDRGPGGGARPLRDAGGGDEGRDRRAGAPPRGARSRDDADPARPPCRRPGGVRRRARRFRRCGGRGLARSGAAGGRDRGARRRRRWRGAVGDGRRCCHRRSRARRQDRGAGQPRARSAPGFRTAGAAARARRPLHPAGRPAATSCAIPRSCRPGATSTASIPSAFRAPSPSRTAGVRPSACWRGMRPADTACRRPWRWSCGARTI